MFDNFKNHPYHENGTHPPHTDTRPFRRDVNHPGGVRHLYPGINQSDHNTRDITTAPENTWTQ